LNEITKAKMSFKYEIKKRGQTGAFSVRLSSLFLLIFLTGIYAYGETVMVEQWGVFEASFKGPAEGNPFVDVEPKAVIFPAATTAYRRMSPGSTMFTM